jgi:LmbE family N-acetylglucosaminyl deacetylase
VLGVTDHRQLGYVDGTLAEIPDAEGVAHVTGALDDVRPDTVITFGPDGYTGHTDHAAVSRWTTLACERWQPAVRLLHVTSTGDFAHRWTDLHRRTNAFPPGMPIPTPPERVAIELRLDRAELDRKLVALTAHSSQVVPLLTLLGEDTVRQWVSSETFTLPRVRSMA